MCEDRHMEQPGNFYRENPKPTPEERLFNAFRDNNTEEIGTLREEYETAYKEQLEGITAIFDFAPFLENRKKLEDPNLKTDEKKEAILGCTEYQYLLTHFVEANTMNDKFLARFWETIEGLAKAMGQSKSALPLRHGILSQVATYKILKAVGKEPDFSMPKDDAFNAIDLWASKDEAVQVKGAPYSTASIVETDDLSFPSTAVSVEGKTEYYSGFLFDNVQKFRAKVSKYSKVVGHDVKGYLVVVPYGEFDPVTGEPTDKIVEMVRESLSKHEPPSVLKEAA